MYQLLSVFVMQLFPLNQNFGLVAIEWLQVRITTPHHLANERWHSSFDGYHVENCIAVV